MANTALAEARRQAGLSQRDLAREIRRVGWLAGDANGCTREMVHRWENGTVRLPQAHYLRLLENVLGTPAGNLGFDADLRYGMNRTDVLEQAGLDVPFTLPDPAESYGPMSGVWLSTYSYVSSGRAAGFTSHHYVVLLQAGARVMVRSVPRSASSLSMALTANGTVVTGTWTERTRSDGYYRGATYVGALQLLEAGPGKLNGRWIGFGKDSEINDGPWSLELTDSRLSPEAVSRWDLAVS
jgi:transcriptional regulator with XRE-family HTH domain